MNVVTPKLLLADYPRANYIKREIENMRRFVATAQKQGDTDLAVLLAEFLETSAVKFRDDLDMTPADIEE